MADSGLELWGGVECTICRVGPRYRNQLHMTGHWQREEDLDQIASLGIRKLRYPVLWEVAQSRVGADFDFSWSDRRLGRLRELGIEVIAGLMHHGSGPEGTDLLDPEFPGHLARYAAAAAQRYPWIKQWTPVNEPLTTARFSTLYGHWYPHHRDRRSFAAAVVNQCKGVRQAMIAIRGAVPDAELVQTDDVGKVFATSDLQYQADVENERRWLAFDLLFGRVDKGHSWFKRLTNDGVSEADLDELADGAGAPALLGVDYYLTSERFLDKDAARYPDVLIGGNGRDAYVDVEAVRVRGLESDLGYAARIHEIWARYSTPLAITEVDHGSTREEQLRWLCQAWQVARQVRSEGVDLRAVTVWSLFGAVDWRSLMTRDEQSYDTSAFDIRSSPPRPTIIATACKALAGTGSFDHPVLAAPGWWQRPDRFYGGAEAIEPAPSGRPIWILGATGTLGQALARTCSHRGLPYVLTARDEVDLGKPATVRAAIERIAPHAIINAAGFVRVADAGREADECFQANSIGAACLAAAAAAAGIPLVSFSSDLVFDGSDGGYVESSSPGPLCVYGESKRRADHAVLAASPDNLVLRTSAFFSAWDPHNFAHQTMTALAGGRQVWADREVRVSPTFVPDLCHAALDLLIDGERGIWHVTNDGGLSWYEWACRIAESAKLPTGRVIARSGGTRDTSMKSERGQLLRPLDAALDDFMQTSLLVA